MPKTLLDLAKEKNYSTQELLLIEQAFAKRLGLWDFLYSMAGCKDMNRIHRDLCSIMERDARFKLILMPRYSFKSTICAVGYSLWRLVKNPNERILIYSDASTKAQGFLTSIKSHLEGKVKGSYIGTLFGEWASDGRQTKWNESQIVIRGRTTSYSEPSIDTGGIETSKVGMHYDLIIFDDIVSDQNITTKEQMDKVEQCYQSALSLLRPGGDVVMVGTRWHFGDLYGRIIAENELKQSFEIFIKPAITDKGEYLFDNVGAASLTKEFLAQQKDKQGSYKFSCLYMNSPVDPETAVFKAKDFSFYGDIKPDDLYITATCDPAGEGEDFTAITVVGTDNNMDMHILEIVNKHLQPSEIISETFRLHYKYNFKIFGLEMNFFRGMLRLEFERRIAEEKINNENFRVFGIHEFEASAKRGEGKHNRIMALQPYHERQAIKFPGAKLELLRGEFSDLAYQMIQFPNAPHDDILDSLAYHLPLIRKGGVVKKQELPKNSPAWLERRAWEGDVEKNNRLPRRWRRQFIGELAFS